eukprot:NODE_5806_length_550_cov_116.984032_g153_i3.p1 GENE.NODE_5806_length_550_cov_116.984032_g153_i3~~NODE_5806_length_550_cov_116.984032_g153_i3.p1  ORF type:complete len:123 (-),score=14.71 NODE_5806_length_550_cov_116.984032_g153_i3:151-519(-)
MRRSGLLVNHEVAQTVIGNFELRPVDWVRMLSGDSVVRVYELVCQIKSSEDEWMYQLEQSQKSSQFANLRIAFEHISTSKLDKAKEAVTQYCSTFKNDGKSQKLLKRLSSTGLQPRAESDPW